MLYLSGAIRPELRHPMLGWMLTPDMGNAVPRDAWWAIDNACYAHAEEPFDLDRFLRFAESRLRAAGERCLFVATPDIPFDAEGTLRRFEHWRDPVRALGAPVAIVTQDGMGAEDVPWADVDAIFVGGTTAWKTGQESAALVDEARRRGKWAHMGRVNSLRRMRAAAAMGCDSVDGTHMKYGPDLAWQEFQRWFAEFERQPVMRLGA